MPTPKLTLSDLFAMRLENREILQANAQDPVKDAGGTASSVLSGDLRFFGACDFLLRRDVEGFRRQLSESARLRVRMLVRREQGEPIDSSYCSLLLYQSILDALAAGAFEIATEIAARLEAKPAEAPVHPFDREFGLAVCAAVLDDRTVLEPRLVAFEAICVNRDRGFLGYPSLFRAISVGDLTNANLAAKSIAVGHEKRSKKAGFFSNLLDRSISLWGLGACNLARHRGIAVEGVPPLIPHELMA